MAAGSFASLRENVKYYQENNYAQLIRTIDLKNNFTNSDFVYVDEVAYDFLWRVQLKEPNIVLPNIGANIGEKYYVKPQDLPKNKNVLGPNAILLRSKCNDTHFVYFRLSTSSYDNEMKKLVGASGQPKFNKTDLKKVSLFMPSLIEQKRIAYFLALLEERIATQNKIIEDLKKLKSAISHILFSSKGAIHLSEIANVVMGQSPSSNAYNDQGLGMPLVQGNLDISNGKTTPRLYTAEFNQTTEKGNIILTVRAPVGEVAKATQKVCLGRGVCAIIPHEENMSDFIYQYLTFYKFMWRRYEQGSTFTSINGSDVRNIFCPKVRNVSILTLLDIKINIEERVVKQYQSQKQYMLYQMFI
ncbi:EcoKI restriction-modification system protein HsdS [Bacteroides cellulosilyticus]|uniref:EcoKI restriction-modification system protein HsdS n=1 Tax=Bacteroides cellulosilyticus TaxID=246787 RepID=A0A0P0GPH9_9BACE|nr:EcoKI restriction-modification system protein HsdS [Bacteroides cellulosilyticus]